ncbi:MAG: hypothetical protein H0Z24_08360 [Thermosipho sp. (in: Bacteria)]|nr:hypothetical protein [Thermosipho sp. (in: thermotogales)]
MEFLKKELEMYKKFTGNIDLNTITFKPTDGLPLNIGDIFVIYTNYFPIYGIVIDKNEDLNECVYLTPELFLASPGALRIKIGHLAEEVALTHIVFYMFEDFSSLYCEKVSDYKDIKKIRDNLEFLSEEIYTGPREEFFNLETEKLLPLYDLFFTKMEEKISEEEKIIRISFPRHLIENYNEELLVAATQGIRGENFLGIIDGEILRLYPEDELAGKKGKIYFRNEKIFEGVIPEVFIVENIKGLSKSDILRYLKIEVIH